MMTTNLADRGGSRKRDRRGSPKPYRMHDSLTAGRIMEACEAGMSSLLTKAQRDLLRKQGRATVESGGEDLGHKPVVKLFNPTGAATWLLSELDPDDDDHAFGLCDLGFGEPEMGWVSLAEIASVRGRFGLPMERDLHFEADKTLTEYWQEARAAGRIVA